MQRIKTFLKEKNMIVGKCALIDITAPNKATSDPSREIT